MKRYVVARMMPFTFHGMTAFSWSWPAPEMQKVLSVRGNAGGCCGVMGGWYHRPIGETFMYGDAELHDFAADLNGSALRSPTSSVTPSGCRSRGCYAFLRSS